MVIRGSRACGGVRFEATSAALMSQCHCPAWWMIGEELPQLEMWPPGMEPPFAREQARAQALKNDEGGN